MIKYRKIENFKIKIFYIGKLTIIVGKSGAGKSSLLKAMLKEMQIVSGDLIWNKYAY